MRLFFHFKIKEFPLYNVLIIFLIFTTSCASHKKAQIREEKISKVIAEARTYTGTPYRYGGTTRVGMDCSGLLCNSFRVVDVTLPRTSEDQSTAGKAVKMKELEPGDLVFFATGKKRRKITHVGMVTEVNGRKDVKFIHASSSLGVIETNLYAAYYQKRYRTARRLIN